MDRPIEPHILKQNRKRKLIQWIAIIMVVVVLFVVFSAWIRPSINRNDIQTDVVQRGTIEGTISASGNVVPRFEQTISSPGETRLLAVKKKPGEHVKKGESLVELDRSEFTLSLERTEKELALKGNRRAQLKLDMERALSDLKGQLNIKELRLKYLQSKSDQSQKMFDLGAISKDQLEQGKLEHGIALIERDELEHSIANTRQSLENQLEGITTEVETLLKEKEDMRRQLDLLSCRADQDGVVTSVIDRIGAAVHRGEIIARVADLGNYRVEATISDVHASRLSVGMPAKVQVNDIIIPGSVQTVYPTIENGIAKIALILDDASHKSLRPNLRVDVSLITSKRERTLKVKKGAFITGRDAQDIFVIRENFAERVAVKIGVMSFDEVEITDGLSEGTEIIISDMSEYSHLTQLKIH